MSIPNFDHNHVIPPFVGSPTVREHVSPYKCTTLELCKHFATSSKRIQILYKYLSFRTKLNEFGVINGFQWLDGSFCENIEESEKRPPNDLDLVTFYKDLSDIQTSNIIRGFREFMYPKESKQNYLLDHYIVDYSYSPESIIENTKYWLQLFSHNRHKIWKGILRIELNTHSEDILALNYLNSLLS